MFWTPKRLSVLPFTKWWEVQSSNLACVEDARFAHRLLQLVGEKANLGINNFNITQDTYIILRFNDWPNFMTHTTNVQFYATYFLSENNCRFVWYQSFYALSMQPFVYFRGPNHPEKYMLTSIVNHEYFLKCFPLVWQLWCRVVQPSKSLVRFTVKSKTLERSYYRIFLIWRAPYLYHSPAFPPIGQLISYCGKYKGFHWCNTIKLLHEISTFCLIALLLNLTKCDIIYNAAK